MTRLIYGPRRRMSVICNYCQTVFTARTPRAKFCSSICRANNGNTKVKLRMEVLAVKGEYCEMCEYKDDWDKVCVRWESGVDKTIENAQVLCYWHNSKLSMRLHQAKQNNVNSTI